MSELFIPKNLPFRCPLCSALLSEDGETLAADTTLIDKAIERFRDFRWDLEIRAGSVIAELERIKWEAGE